MHQGHALILFSNLASNLLKYGLPGEASVTFDRQNNCLTFQNFGAQTGLENTIFEYRTRGDNRGNEPGSGLGLNIVKYICGAYGITVEHVESGSGAIVLHNFAFYMPPEMINRGN
jgi:signal transduction histidine kinase